VTRLAKIDAVVRPGIVGVTRYFRRLLYLGILPQLNAAFTQGWLVEMRPGYRITWVSKNCLHSPGDYTRRLKSRHRPASDLNAQLIASMCYFPGFKLMEMNILVRPAKAHYVENKSRFRFGCRL
jgi:hypothetical protein